MAINIGKDIMIAPTIVRLPRYTKEQFKKFYSLTPSHQIEDGVVSGFAAETLKPINIWWRTAEETEVGLQRFKAAFTLPSLPQREAKDARREYEAAQHLANQVTWGMDLFLKSSHPTWEQVEEVSSVADDWYGRKRSDNQVVALCEAVSETSREWTSEDEMRQKVAQYAWDELIDTFPYAKVNDKTITTRDELEVEKSEIREQLEGEFWDTEDRQKAGVNLRKYMGQMRQGEYEPRLRRAFQKLHDCAFGEVPENTSAVDILKLEEEILVGLYNENAFDLED
jgi:hypothetical protein